MMIRVNNGFHYFPDRDYSRFPGEFYQTPGFHLKVANDFSWSRPVWLYTGPCGLDCYT